MSKAQLLSSLKHDPAISSSVAFCCLLSAAMAQMSSVQAEPELSDRLFVGNVPEKRLAFGVPVAATTDCGHGATAQPSVRAVHGQTTGNRGML